VTKTKKLRVLREIYASIPSVGCKGLCTISCSTVPVFAIELEQLEAATGRKLPTVLIEDDQFLGGEIGAPCPLLVMRRCSVYDQRPLICRAFGAVEGLPCPHGCEPDKLVSKADQYRNFARVSAL
jgi:Fe-S-cluster containining protein